MGPWPPSLCLRPSLSDSRQVCPQGTWSLLHRIRPRALPGLICRCYQPVAKSLLRHNGACSGCFFFREAILMMELPRRHAASLKRAAGSHPIRVQSMGGGRGRDRAQMTYSSSGLLSGSVWQMRRLWLAAHQTPPACASIPWCQSCLVCGKRQWGLEQGSLSKWCRDIRNKV